MSKSNKVDEILQQGIHGPKETKPDERRRFFSTSLRERVVVALMSEPGNGTEVYQDVANLMKENSAAHLFLNGNLDYSYLSKYITIAKKVKIEFTIVTNKDYDSDLGLVLAHNEAIDKEEIFVTKKFLPMKKRRTVDYYLSFRTYLKNNSIKKMGSPQ